MGDGTSKRARRRRRKFGQPIGYYAKFDPPVFNSAWGTYTQIQQELPIYKNAREEQAAKDQYRQTLRKWTARMRLNAAGLTLP